MLRRILSITALLPLMANITSESSAVMERILRCIEFYWLARATQRRASTQDLPSMRCHRHQAAPPSILTRSLARKKTACWRGDGAVNRSDPDAAGGHFQGFKASSA